MGRLSLWFLLGLTILAVSLHDLQVSAEAGPSESECRPYIEKALHELKTTDTDGADASTEASEGNTSEDRNTSDGNNSIETEEENEAKQGTDSEVDDSTDDDTDRKEDSEEDTNSKKEGTTGNDADSTEDNNDSKEEEASKSNSNEDAEEENNRENLEKKGDVEITSDEQQNSQESDGTVRSSIDDEDHENESNKSVENDDNSQIDDSNEKQVDESSDNDDDENKTEEGDENSRETENETEEIDADGTIETNDNKVQSDEDDNQSEETKKDDEQSEEDDVNINSNKDEIGDGKSAENDEVETEENSKEKSEEKSKENDVGSIEETASREENYIQNAEKNSENSKEDQDMNDTEEDQSTEEATDKIKEDDDNDVNNTNEIIDESKEKSAEVKEDDDDNESDDDTADSSEDNDDNNESEETQPEDDLLLEVDIPENLRDRKHISELLHLDDEFEEKETAISNVADTILRDLKRIYENAIKPLEALYKYRDLSNRHFGDPEIFSKPLVLFMGPWSGGKSTIINYLTGNEYTDNSLRSGAEPSPAYFNILMHGDGPEVLDGTQLAADWTFSGLQKFGQGLEDRLRGLRLPHKLLEKVNIVEIPGILEVRKQVSRLFPFNDACQWFIDRADIIFLVYDPAKLDVGPETEAILDQLKGREYQTRIVLNKADLVKPEELLRVQSALIWNISPLMSSAQPPVMYTTSLWSHPYESSSPVRLLQAQERAFLRDLRTAIDKRIENKIASARRFAVRVRNHAKMVDCYLTTYYNHKSLFGNKKRISDQIIESPQNYHIYEGLSTLTNISRYDLPDPEVYRDFFRLNPLYEFKKLSETCTYFRGCPINKLDVAIAYDLPELVGKYKKMAESAVAKLDSTDTEKDKS